MRDKFKKSKYSAFEIILFAVLLIYALTIIIVLLWGLNTSLKSHIDYSLLNNKLNFPSLELSKNEIFFGNYKKIWENFEFVSKKNYYSNGKLITHKAEINIFMLLVNTLIYAGLGSLLRAFVPCVVAYLCAKYKYIFSKIIFTICVFLLTMPIVGSQTSEIAFLRSTGLYDTYIGTIFQQMGFTGIYFFVFFAYFEGLSNAYTEAAEIDGASQLSILVKIIFPLAGKVIGTIILLQFVTLWNDYQTPLLYLPTKPTLAYGTYYMAFLNPVGELAKLTYKVTSCMILAIPLFVVFLIFRNKMMGNVTMGGIKE